ncbi:Putative ribonuclease H protein At1g65750 [Linum perenne]
MVEASQQSIGNGRDTSFWLSKWVDDDVVLANHTIYDLSDEEKKRYVADATNQEGEWDWNFLRTNLPTEIINLVAGMEPPTSDDREDELIWGLDPKGPNRVRHFIWLFAHERVLTNVERCRRHMAQDNNCYHCPDSREDLLHVGRDCKLAKEVWLSLFPHLTETNFFSLGLQDWLRAGIQERDFSLSFGLVIWLLWKARNEVVFEHKPATSDQLRLRVLHWIAGVRETMRAESRVLFKQAHDREEVLVQWEPAPEDFITINTGGSVLQPNRHASAGGILRDLQGRKIAAFAANLGSCSIMRAELRAAEIGLKIAWELGYRKAHL